MRTSIGLCIVGALVACSRPAPEALGNVATSSPASPVSIPSIGQEPASAAGPGPAIGQVLPPFEAPDQHGQRQSLASLAGPNGLYLNFNRSVVW